MISEILRQSISNLKLDLWQFLDTSKQSLVEDSSLQNSKYAKLLIALKRPEIYMYQGPATQNIKQHNILNDCDPSLILIHNSCRFKMWIFDSDIFYNVIGPKKDTATEKKYTKTF